MYNLFIKIILFLNVTCLFAQEFDWAYGIGGWVNDYAFDITPDADSNIYFAGRLPSISYADPLFTSNYFIAKLSKNGDVQWVKNFESHDTYNASMTVDNDGYLYLSGEYGYNLEIDGVKVDPVENTRIFLAKFTTNGQLLWIKTYGSSEIRCAAYVTKITSDKNNNTFLTGSFSKSFDVGDTTYTARGSKDMFIMKLSPKGEVLKFLNPGSTGDEYLYDIAVNDDGIYAVGYAPYKIIEINGSDRILDAADQGIVMKFDTTGRYLWSRSIISGGSSKAYNANLNDNGELLVVNFWIESSPAAGGGVTVTEYLCITKYDKYGNELHNQKIKYYEPYSYSEGHGSNIKWGLTTLNKDYYLSVGLFGSVSIGPLKVNIQGPRDAVFIKFNEVGYPQWYSIGKGNYIDRATEIANIGNTFFIAGTYSSDTLNFGNQYIINNSGNSNDDIYVAKLTDTSKTTNCPEVDSFKISYPNIICNEDSVKLTIDNQYATYTAWYKNNIKLPEDNKKEIYIKNSGHYSVHINSDTRCPVPVLSVNVEYAENGNDSTDIRIYQKPIADIEGPDEICFGEPISISSKHNAGYEYSWDASNYDQLESDDTNSILVTIEKFQDSIDFHLHVVDTISSCSSDDFSVTYIRQLPEVNLYQYPSDSIIHVYSRYSDSIYWYLNNDEFIDNRNNAYIIPVEEGYYYVIAKNNYGCTSISDSLLFSSQLNITDNRIDELIYPNPVMDILYIIGTEPIDKMELFDCRGVKIKEISDGSEIVMKDLKQGIYMLRMHINNSIKNYQVIKK